METAYAFLAQAYFIPSPPLTEKNIPDQAGKVFIVTGGYSGLGEKLSDILYSANATVYIAGRSPEKGQNAIKSIQSRHPTSRGKVIFLYVDLADLTTVKPAVQEFLSKEERLDVLWNNAGFMYEESSKTNQGHEKVISTNTLAPFLLTNLLLPLLKRTAAQSSKGSVRIIWASSIGVEVQSPSGGVLFTTIDGKEHVKTTTVYRDYGMTKAASYFLGTEFARRHGRDGILSCSFNPGNLQTGLQRHFNVEQPWSSWFIRKFLLQPSIFGAYTELYAGLSPELDIDKDNGAYIWPWGRKGKIYRKDITAGTQPPKDSGGKSVAERLWDWCERETAAYE